MKRSFPGGIWLVILITLIPLVYLCYVYSGLPESIPMHFDINGKPNGYGKKESIWFVMSLLIVVSIGLYLLITNLAKIDPKKTAGQSPELFQKIAFTLVILLSAINMIVVYAATGGPMNINHFIVPLEGFAFAILGNYMHSIKPNYFAGFRLPWTLDNADNWRKTHQLASRVWVTGGILIVIVSFLLPPRASYIFFLVTLLFMVGIPAVFSYRYFKKHQTDQQP